MKTGTQHNLITDLEKESAKHPLARVIKIRAENGDYHDLKSELPCPKVLLHRDCEIAGLDSIAKKVFKGEYDEI